MDEDGPARNIAGTPARLVHKKSTHPAVEMRAVYASYRVM